MSSEFPEFRIVIEHDGLRKHEHSILKGFGRPGRDEATQEGRDDMDRRMGAAIEQSIKDWIPLIHFDDQIRCAFDGIAQKDGPPDRCSVVEVGAFTRKCPYQTFGWQSADPAKIVERFEALAKSIRYSGRDIVWRKRPHVLYKNPDGIFYTSCRFHVLPYEELPGSKVEGELMSEV